MLLKHYVNFEYIIVSIVTLATYVYNHYHLKRKGHDLF